MQKLADLSALAFVISSMLAMGMSQTLADVIAPLRKPAAVLLALGVNFVVAVNPGAARTGTLTVAGKTVTFNQAGGGNATPPVAPANLHFVK